MLSFKFRNVGFGSISIWTHNLKGIRWDEAFIPAKAPRGYPPTSAIIYGAGVQWDDINYAAWEADKMVVGGASGVCVASLQPPRIKLTRPIRVLEPEEAGSSAAATAPLAIDSVSESTRF